MSAEPGLRPEGQGSVRAVSRAISVLSAFRGDAVRLPIAAVVRTTGLPRTTVLRLIDTLCDEGMLEYDRDGLVRPGAGLMNWASLAGDAWRVPDAALERMHELAEDSGETVSFYVRSATSRRVIAQAQPVSNRLRHVVEVGDTLPLWGGAAAAVLLAQEAPDARSDLIAAILASGSSPFSFEEIAQRADEAAASGFAVSHGLRERGNSGAAVPILGDDGKPLPIAAALALGGPTERFEPTALDRFESLLRDAADGVRALGLPLALR